MKNIRTIAIIGGLVLIGLWLMSFYNGTIGLNEDVTKQWSNVENAYQLRADKTKNLVEIVKGAADFEKETLTQVVEARAKATSTTINAGDLSPEKIQAVPAGAGPVQQRAVALAGHRGALPRTEGRERLPGFPDPV